MNDFATDMDELGVVAEHAKGRATHQEGAGLVPPSSTGERYAPRSPAAPSSLAGAFDGDFWKGILPAGVKVETYSGRKHLCGRCIRTADECARRGQPAHEVRECESWVDPQGHRCWAGTCAPCTDLEFSIRWKRRHAAANKENDLPALRELENQKRGWVQKGRAFLG